MTSLWCNFGIAKCFRVSTCSSHWPELRRLSKKYSPLLRKRRGEKLRDDGIADVLSTRAAANYRVFLPFQSANAMQRLCGQLLDLQQVLPWMLLDCDLTLPSTHLCRPPTADCFPTILRYWGIQLGIPRTVYAWHVQMWSSHFISLCQFKLFPLHNGRVWTREAKQCEFQFLTPSSQAIRNQRRDENGDNSFMR